MLITTWLSVLNSKLGCSCKNLDAELSGWSNPWRNREMAYRSNPFVPTVRVKAESKRREQRSEMRWRVRQRQF